MPNIFETRYYFGGQPKPSPRKKLVKAFLIGGTTAAIVPFVHEWIHSLPKTFSFGMFMLGGSLTMLYETRKKDNME